MGDGRNCNYVLCDSLQNKLLKKLNITMKLMLSKKLHANSRLEQPICEILWKIKHLLLAGIISSGLWGDSLRAIKSETQSGLKASNLRICVAALQIHRLRAKNNKHFSSFVAWVLKSLCSPPTAAHPPERSLCSSLSACYVMLSN